MNRNFPALLLAAVLCTVLDGCVPNVTKYWRVNAPGADYLNSVCYGSSGPRSITYYPYHGIFISIQLSEPPVEPAVALAVHIPSGSAVSINDTVVRIQGLSPAGSFETTFTLRSAPRAVFVLTGPRKIYSSQDPRASDHNFGPLAGGDEHGTLLWYPYAAKGSIPREITSGTLTLPSLTIDGRTYEEQVLTFTRETFTGIMPINC